MGDKYAGPDYSDIAESMASSVATGAIAPMGKSFGKQLSKMGKKAKGYVEMYGGPGSKGYVPPTRNKVANTPMARAKMADKAPKINLRKEYKD